MAKAKKTNPWLIYGGLAVTIGLAAYLNMPSAATPKPLKKTSAPTGGGASKTAVATDDTSVVAEDYKVHFDPYVQPVKNTFLPVVHRNDKTGSGGGAAANNSIPSEFTDGESDWIYTGNAQIDGKSEALVENASTGAGEFLHVGETWKTMVVKAITDDGLSASGPDGEVQTISMLTTPKAEEVKPVSPTTPVSPMSGPINVLPFPTDNSGTFPNMGGGNFGGNFGGYGGGGGGGRRGRGGYGGGGGGFGGGGGGFGGGRGGGRGGGFGAFGG